MSAHAASGTAAMSRPVSPYKGLTPFEDSELDELLFFGREREREVIAANLVAARATVLYGSSGVGKSSVLGAGVARDLRALPERPLVVVHSAWAEDAGAAIAASVGFAAGIEPGSLGETLEVACALHGEVYLVLDQLEEYFVSRGRDPALGDVLAELLDRTELPVHVLLGIREDVLARLDAFKGAVPGLLANRLRLEHLTREAGRRAIVGPVDRFAELVSEEEGLGVEPELVDAVLDGVSAGAFLQESLGRGSSDHARVEAPYLQLVMQRLWEVERAEGSRLLRLRTLERLGGPRRIVEEHLERALAALTPQQKVLAARMFNHLVTPSGTKLAHGTRDLAGYAAASENELEPVLAALGRERILRPVGTAVGNAHEIYHDVLADAVLGWRGRFEAEQALALARRRHRRIVAVAVISLVALAITAAIAVFALAQRSQARSEATRAHARELDATALARLTTDPQAALASALRAAKLSPGPQAEDVLRTTLLASRLRAVLSLGQPVRNALYSRDGRLILAAGADGTVRLYDGKTMRSLRTIHAGAQLAGAILDPAGRLVVTEGADGAGVWSARSGRLAVRLRTGRVLAAAFSQGGGLLATGGADGAARIWRSGSWKLYAVLHHPTPVTGVSFNPNGRLLVTRSRDGFARIFSTRDGSLVHTLDGGRRLTSTAFSPDGKFVITVDAEGAARIWRATSGMLRHELRSRTGRIQAVSVARKGKIVVTGSSDGSVRVWAFPGGDLLTVMIGHRLPVTGAAFSPDGFSLVTTSVDRTARVWQPGTGDLRAVLAGHTESVTGAAFRPDGRAVVTAGADETARVWDPQIQPLLRLFARVGGPLYGAAFSGGGRVLVVGRDGVSIRDASTKKVVLSLASAAAISAGAATPDASRIAAAAGREITIEEGGAERRLRARADVVSLAFAPDGTLAAGNVRGRIEVWSPAGALLRTLRAARRGGTHVAFSPDGKRLVAGANDGRTRVWSIPDGRLELTLVGHRAAVTSARFDPDGTRIVTASADHDARTWDASTGRPLRVLRAHRGPVADAEFSPDGRWITTAGPSTAGLWDARTGELLFFLRGHTARLTSAAFDPASRRIVTASEDGTVRTYRCDVCGALGDLVALAEQRLRAAR